MVNQSDSVIWLQFDNHYTTYMANLGPKIFSRPADKVAVAEACHIQENFDIIRLGETAQVMIRAILKTLQNGHDKDKYYGDNIDPDNIWFKDGDLTVALIEHNSHATKKKKRTDYRNVDNLITFLITKFEINENFLPQDLLHLRNLLQSPKGMELHILNHFSLWGYKERDAFVKKLDNLKTNKVFANSIFDICNEIENRLFGDKFDLSLYVITPSVISARIDIGERADMSFGYVFRLMRNTYIHGKTYGVCR
ncbi:hypothetical protein FRX31_021354 [Thalictrum thalictroides]|uniref:Uncharacterized protein n=1 Tax=Thalictrum thalictroides TaxID=46969 RepID=A0A7J6VWS7_THATH|nr:hypothetical protein FRX31_021354 [Thalictrum thalictroides]